MPAGNAVERPGSGHHSCRTCSTQRMPLGHDKAVENPGQLNCPTTAFTGVSFRVAAPSHAFKQAAP